MRFAKERAKMFKANILRVFSSPIPNIRTIPISRRGYFIRRTKVLIIFVKKIF